MGQIGSKGKGKGFGKSLGMRVEMLEESIKSIQATLEKIVQKASAEEDARTREEQKAEIELAARLATQAEIARLQLTCSNTGAGKGSSSTTVATTARTLSTQRSDASEQSADGSHPHAAKKRKVIRAESIATVWKDVGMRGPHPKGYHDVNMLAITLSKRADFKRAQWNRLASQVLSEMPADDVELMIKCITAMHGR